LPYGLNSVQSISIKDAGFNRKATRGAPRGGFFIYDAIDAGSLLLERQMMIRQVDSFTWRK
jgi:hypothetical protein